MKSTKAPLHIVAATIVSLFAVSSFADPLSLPKLSIPSFELPEVNIDVEIPTPDLDELWEDLALELIVGPNTDVTEAE